MEWVTYEVNSNRVEEVFIERILCVPQQQAGLAHSRVPNQQHLKQKVTTHAHGHQRVGAYYSWPACCIASSHSSLKSPARIKLQSTFLEND